MKRLFFILASTCFFTISLTAPSQAFMVHCVNCSDNWTQQMDRVTNLEQLQNMIKSYQEAIEQTRQQIALVQNNIQQYENMLKNTLNLPQNMLGEMKGQFSNLAKLTNQLNFQKGDYMAMGQVFDEIYPGVDIIKGMVGGDGNMDSAELWEKWSKESDRATQATFQITGSQLKDLAENSEALDQHVSNLLSTPEGQMQAIQSGNSLAAIQIDEARKLRALMAASIQGETQLSAQNEKQEQLMAEEWEKFTTEKDLLEKQKNVQADKF